MAALVVMILGIGPPALSAAARVGPGAAVSPCSAAAADGHGPEPPYEQPTLLPSDLSAAAPVEGTMDKVFLCVCTSDLIIIDLFIRSRH